MVRSAALRRVSNHELREKKAVNKNRENNPMHSTNH
ncbi:hypothetical protein ACVWYQ_002934 [Bradyrhizobium sp. USDA 3397]